MNPRIVYASRDDYQLRRYAFRLSEVDSGIRRYRARFCNRVAEDARSDGASFPGAANVPPNADALSVILGLFGGAKPRDSLRKQSHFGRHAGNFITICVGKYFGCSSTVGRFIQIVIERDPDILEQVL